MERLTREEALERLEQQGISGPDVYLINLIPLIEKARFLSILRALTAPA